MERPENPILAPGISNPAYLEAEAGKLGEFSFLAKDRNFDEDNGKPSKRRGGNPVVGFDPSLSGNFGKLDLGGDNELPQPKTPGPPPPPIPPPPKKRDKPITINEKKIWEKLIATASKRTDAPVITAKLYQIQNYKNLFPSLQIDKFNPDTVTVEELELILLGIENQLAQPHTKEAAKMQFMGLCYALKYGNETFDLGLKTTRLLEVADLRYHAIEHNWLELLCKYNLMVPSKVELRVARDIYGVFNLAGQVEEGKVTLMKSMSKPYYSDSEGNMYNDL